MLETDENLAQKSANVWDAHLQQRVFRKLMKAFAYPGRVESIDELVHNSELLLALLATLVDGQVSLADPQTLLKKSDWPKLEAYEKGAEEARFIVALGADEPSFTPTLGTLESPEMGASILVQVEHIGSGQMFTLRGPGIEKEEQVSLLGWHASWLTQRQKWNSSFPLGVDFIFFDKNSFFALPRTTAMKVKEG